MVKSSGTVKSQRRMTGRQGVNTSDFASSQEVVAQGTWGWSECSIINAFPRAEKGLGLGEVKWGPEEDRREMEGDPGSGAGTSSLPPHPLPPGQSEICGFRLHGSRVPFEAVILDRGDRRRADSGQGAGGLRGPEEHTFTIRPTMRRRPGREPTHQESPTSEDTLPLPLPSAAGPPTTTRPLTSLCPHRLDDLLLPLFMGFRSLQPKGDKEHVVTLSGTSLGSVSFDRGQLLRLSGFAFPCL